MITKPDPTDAELAAFLTEETSLRERLLSDQQSRERSERRHGYIEDWKPHAKTRELISNVQTVLQEYKAHWPLTVRQIFYRLVGKYDYAKSESAYSNLAGHIANARRAREIEFTAIRDDGTRSSGGGWGYADIDEFLELQKWSPNSYRLNISTNQPRHIEVWCETAGMPPQLGKVAERFFVKAYSGSGYDSLTAKKDLADRICRNEKPAVILHLGDYDPDGEDLFRALKLDVAAFVGADRYDDNTTATFERVALTQEQVAYYDLPTAPPKETSTRTKRFAGDKTCQLEALAPDQIAALLTAAIEVHFDRKQYKKDMEQQAKDRKELARIQAEQEAKR